MYEPSPPLARPPVFNNVPGEVIALCAAIAAVSALILLAPRALSDTLFTATAVFAGPGAAETPQPLGKLAPYALHVFAHGSWAHLGLNLAALLAFGAAVARRLQAPWRFFALFFAAAIAGALVEAAAFPERATTLVGASGGVFGLIGATAWFMGSGFRAAPRGAGYAPLAAVAARLAPWAIINVVVGLAGGDFLGLGHIAWVAHLGGLAAGAALFPVLDRAGR